MSSPRGEKTRFRESSRTREYDDPSEETSDLEPEQQQPQQQHARPQPRQKNRQKPLQRRGGPLGGGALNKLPLDGVGQTVGNVTSGVTDTLGNVAGNALDNKDGKKKDTLRLRLDLNLEIEITLKAKIHGDLELALLN